MPDETPELEDGDIANPDLQTTEFRIAVKDAGTRIDRFLSSRHDDVSRSQLKKWIEKDNVKVNGLSVSPGSKLREGDIVAVSPPEASDSPLPAENISLDVIHEDSEIIVVNKACGMVVHPAPGHSSGTLVNALLHHCNDLKGIGGVERPGIVHRLDKETSGVIVAAKSEPALNHLALQFKERTIKKEYLALARGKFKRSEGTITASVGRHKKHRKKMIANEEGGRSAETSWSLIRQYEHFAFVSLFPKTGRTHQIRVHLASINHPILGDPLYGGKSQTEKFPRCALHAHKLELQHPASGKRMQFAAPLAPDIDAYLKNHESTLQG